MEAALHELESIAELSIRRNVTAKKLTTFAIGGELSLLLEPNSVEALCRALSVAASAGIAVRFLGAGSNLLVADEGVIDWVIKLGKGFRTFRHIEAGLYEVGGAMPLMTLARSVSNAGHSGLEFAGGIPASLGGAVRMNAGAHGGEMVDVLTEVRLALRDGRVEWVPARNFSFSYRFAAIPEGAVVIGARLRCVESDTEKTASKLAECLAYRKRTQPLTLPSAGSVFRNPNPDQAAGMLIEAAGLKGYSIGGASVSDLHANWIVNPERTAGFKDVTDLIEHCQNVVKEQSGVALEPEVVRWPA